MVGPRVWTIVDDGFRLGIYDATTWPHTVYTVPLVAHWWDRHDPTVWSALIEIDGDAVEITSEHYCIPQEARDSSDRPRCCWLIAPEDTPAPDGVRSEEGV
jgi:hypothetical protein